MHRLLKIGLLTFILIIVAGFLAIVVLPAAVRALPGQIRGRLPEEILRAVTTPLPTALPAPVLTPANISDILSPAPEPVEGNNSPSATSTLPLATRHSPLATRHSPLATPTPPPATPTPPPDPVEEPPSLLATRHPPLATQAALSGLTIVPQKLNNCGPATLSINLNYYGLEQTQFDVAAVVKPHYDDRNVSPQELVDYTNNQTPLRAKLFRGGDLDLLKRLIAAGFPVVIEKGYEPDAWQGWMGHYLTLYGYDDESAEFLTMDTYLGPWDGRGLPVSYETLDKGWQHFNYTFYVVYPPEQEETLLEITGPTLNDETAMWQQTLARARTEVAADAANAFAWFNLGSSLTHLAQLTADSQLTNQAVSVFDQARLIGLPPRMLWYQFEPYEAYLASNRIEDVLTLTAAILDNAGGSDVEETFFYRGQAFQAQGDPEAAIRDYRRALELRPGYQDAEKELEIINH